MGTFQGYRFGSQHRAGVSAETTPRTANVYMNLDRLLAVDINSQHLHVSPSALSPISACFILHPRPD